MQTLTPFVDGEPTSGGGETRPLVDPAGGDPAFEVVEATGAPVRPRAPGRAHPP
jgi:hypothetical protein